MNFNFANPINKYKKFIISKNYLKILKYHKYFFKFFILYMEENILNLECKNKKEKENINLNNIREYQEENFHNHNLHITSIILTFLP